MRIMSVYFGLVKDFSRIFFFGKPIFQLFL